MSVGKTKWTYHRRSKRWRRHGQDWEHEPTQRLPDDRERTRKACTRLQKSPVIIRDEFRIRDWDSDCHSRDRGLLWRRPRTSRTGSLGCPSRTCHWYLVWWRPTNRRTSCRELVLEVARRHGVRSWGAGIFWSATSSETVKECTLSWGAAEELCEDIIKVVEVSHWVNGQQRLVFIPRETQWVCKVKLAYENHNSGHQASSPRWTDSAPLEAAPHQTRNREVEELKEEKMKG